jgi:hypothetical protein
MRIGEHVAFKAAFLKSIAGHSLGHLRGVVIDIDGMIAKVHWTAGGEGPLHVLVKNLTPVKRLHLELS